MARVELAAAALDDLDGLIVTHSLPSDTRTRVRACLSPLALFPRLGPELTGRWSGMRFLLGPWRWMTLAYVVLDEDQRVVVVTIQDARSSRAATVR